MEKPAQTGRPIHELLRRRWSPRAFSDRAVPAEVLLKILEAARWAPSASNRQPWSFVVGVKGQGTGHDAIRECLMPGNRVWAGRAPVLMVAEASAVTEDGKPNAWAQYDTGQAAAHLSIQAMADEVWVHQMGGFDKEAIRKALGIPEHGEPVAVIALGYGDDPNVLPAEMREREVAPRQRKDLKAFVHANKWGEKPAFIA